MCMARLPGPAELQSHFEKVHSEGGGNDAQMPDEPEVILKLTYFESCYLIIHRLSRFSILDFIFQGM